jgi:hypothetical protein
MEMRPASFPYNGLSKLVLFKVNKLCAVDVADEVVFFELLERESLVFWLYLALPRIDIKMNVQPGIFFLVLLDREFSPYPPVLEGGLIPVLHTLEPSCSHLLYFGVVFSVPVDFDIDLEEMLDGVLSKLFVVTVFFETTGDEAKLGLRVRPRKTQLGIQELPEYPNPQDNSSK